MPITNLISLLCLCLSLCVSVSLSFFSMPSSSCLSFSLSHYLSSSFLSLYLSAFRYFTVESSFSLFLFLSSIRLHTHTLYALLPVAFRLSLAASLNLFAVYLFCRVAKNSNSTGFCSSFSNFPPFHLSSELAINLNSANHRAVVEKVEIE